MNNLIINILKYAVISIALFAIELDIVQYLGVYLIILIVDVLSYNEGIEHAQNGGDLDKIN